MGLGDRLLGSGTWDCGVDWGVEACWGYNGGGPLQGLRRCLVSAVDLVRPLLLSWSPSLISLALSTSLSPISPCASVSPSPSRPSLLPPQHQFPSYGPRFCFPLGLWPAPLTSQCSSCPSSSFRDVLCLPVRRQLKNILIKRF